MENQTKYQELIILLSPHLGSSGLNRRGSTPLSRIFLCIFLKD